MPDLPQSAPATGWRPTPTDSPEALKATTGATTVTPPRGMETQFRPTSTDSPEAQNAIIGDESFTYAKRLNELEQANTLYKMADFVGTTEEVQAERDKLDASYWIAMQMDVPAAEVYRSFDPEGYSPIAAEYFGLTTLPRSWGGRARDEIEIAYKSWQARNMMKPLMLAKEFNPEDYQKVNDLLNSMPKLDPVDKRPLGHGGVIDWFKDIPIELIRQFPSLAKMGFWGAVGQIGGGAIGTAIGTPALGVTLGSIGRKIGVGLSTWSEEATSIYFDTMFAENPETGKRLWEEIKNDPEKVKQVATWASVIAGGVIGGLEVIGTEVLIGKSAELLPGLAKRTISDLGSKGVFRSTLGNLFFKTFPKGVVSEVTTEELESLAEQFAKDVALKEAQAKHGTDIPPGDWRTYKDVIFQTFDSVLKLQLIIGMPGATSEAVALRNKIINGENLDDTLERVKEITKTSVPDIPVAKANLFRTPEGKLYGVQRETVTNADGSVRSIIKYGDPTVAGDNRYGHAVVTGGEGQIVIDELVSEKDYNIKQDIIQQIAADHYGQDIIWNPTNDEDADLKAAMIAANPRGEQYGLQYNAATVTLDRYVTEMANKYKMDGSKKALFEAFTVRLADAAGEDTTTFLSKRIDERIAIRETAKEFLEQQAGRLNIPYEVLAAQAGGAEGVRGAATYFDAEGNEVSFDATSRGEYARAIKGLVYAFENADFSTAIHETFHVVERYGLTNEQTELFEKAIGKKRADWANKDVEFLADGLEHFLATGEVNIPGMRGVFDEIAAIMRGILESFGVKLEEHSLPDNAKRAYRSLLARMDYGEDVGVAMDGADSVAQQEILEKAAEASSIGLPENIGEQSIQFQVKPPFAGEKRLNQWVGGLDGQAQATFHLFDDVVKLGKHGKTNYFTKFWRTDQWNKQIAKSEAARKAAIAAYNRMPSEIRERMHLNPDGTITAGELEGELRMQRSFTQRLVDALPLENVPSTMMVNGKEIRLSDASMMQSVGGESYRRALVEEYRKLFMQDKLESVSPNSLRVDNWGALGFLSTNSKTGISGDFTTLCPQLFYNLGCWYCYRLSALKSGVNNKLVGEKVWYTGELLRLSKEDVIRMNNNGGLRVQSFGDWMPHFSGQFTDMLVDAELLGKKYGVTLQIKVITKEPSMVEFAAKLKEQGLGKKMFFNLSADYNWELAGKIDASIKETQPVNPDRPFMRVGDKAYWKRALSPKEAAEYRKKYDWVNVRIVATTIDEFIRGLKDPNIDVVTGYHGWLRVLKDEFGNPMERIDVETGEMKVEIEPLGDAGMPRFLPSGELDSEFPGKSKVQKKLGKAVAKEGLQREYFKKVCCQTGKCATCNGICGLENRKDSLLIKNESNRDQDNIYANSIEAVNLQTTALHGTGYWFDTFDFTNMGKGEGSQAFGWGMYLTGVEDVAKVYADVVGRKGLRGKADLSINGESVPLKYAERYNTLMYGLKENVQDNLRPTVNFLANDVNRKTKELEAEKAKPLAKRSIYATKNLSESIEAGRWLLARLGTGKVEIGPAKPFRVVYTVSMEKDNWLSWYENIPDNQKTQILEKAKADGLTERGYLWERAKQQIYNGDGQNTYWALKNLLGSDKKASQWLNDAGIDGIKFPVGTLKGGNSQKSFSYGTNYVVFDSNNMNIKDRITFQGDPDTDSDVQWVTEAKKYKSPEDFQADMEAKYRYEEGATPEDSKWYKTMWDRAHPKTTPGVEAKHDIADPVLENEPEYDHLEKVGVAKTLGFDPALADKTTRGDLTAEETDNLEQQSSGDAESIKAQLAYLEAEAQSYLDDLTPELRRAIRIEEQAEAERLKLINEGRRMGRAEDRIQRAVDEQNAYLKGRRAGVASQAHADYLETRQKIADLKQQYREAEAKRKAGAKLKKARRKLLKDIMRPPSIAVEFVGYADEIMRLQAGIDPNNRSARTLAERQKSREFLATHADAAALIDDEKLAKLYAVPANALTMAQLEEINEMIQNLRDLGKLKRGLKLAQDRKVVKQAQAEGISQVLNGEIPKKPVGPPEKTNAAMWALIQTWKPSNVALWLDGGKPGFFTHWLVDEVNDKWGQLQKAKRARTEIILNKMEELKLYSDPGNLIKKAQGYSFLGRDLDFTTSNYPEGFKFTNNRKPTAQQAMFWYIGKRNEKTKLALLHGNNYTEEMMDKAIAQLTSQEIELADLISDDFSNNFGRLRDAFIATFNMDLRHEAFYVPMVRTELDYTDRKEAVLDDLAGRQGLRKEYVARNPTHERLDVPEGYQTPVRDDLFNVWLDHITISEGFIIEDRLVKQLHSIMETREMKQAVTQMHGSNINVWIERYINDVARKDIYDVTTGMQRFARKARGNMAVAWLGFNMLSNAKQLTSVMGFMADANPINIAIAAAQFAAGQGKSIAGGHWLGNTMIEFVEERSELIRNRSISQEFEDLKRMNATGYEQVVKKIGAVSMKSLEIIDKVSVSIGWLAVYNKEMRKNGGDEILAAKAADTAVVRTQPSGRVQDLPSMYRSGDTMKMFTMFTSELNAIWNRLTFGAVNLPNAIKNGTWTQFVGDVVSIAMVGVAIAAMGGALAGDDEDKKKKAMLNGLWSQFADSIPLVGSDISALLQGKFRSSGVKLIPYMDYLFKVPGNVKDGDMADAMINLLKAGGFAVGVPVTGTERLINTIESGQITRLLNWPEAK